MNRLLLLAALLPALTGCLRQIVPPTPRVGCAVCEPDRRIALGQPLHVDADWTGLCESPHPLEGPPKTVTWNCGSERFVLEVSCSAPCEVRSGDAPLDAPRKASKLDVVPAVAGPFSFTVKARSVESGREHVYSSPTLTIRIPDAVGLYCLYEQGFEACDDRPLDAAAPLIVPVAELNGRQFEARGALINGRAYVPRHVAAHDPAGRKAMSLAEVVEREGPLPPGAYTVTVSRDGLTSTRTVVVR